MAFTGNAFCTSAKVGFLTGTYTPLADTMKIALYTNLATLDITTTVYTTSGEVVGTGYTAGGNTLTGAAISYDAASPGTAWITFSNTAWATATFTARGALIYDSTRSNAAIAVLDFGADKTATAGTFTVQIPAAAAATALIRIA
jgi:hypothetical protein